MKKNGVASIIISAVLFGMMPLLTKVAYQYGSNAYSVAFGRFFFGSVILLMVITAIPNYSLKVSGQQMKQLAGLSLAYALTPVLLYASYNNIDSGLATTLHFTYPIAVIVMMALFFREKPTRKQFLCTLLCMIGILLLYTPKGRASGIGIAFAAVSGLTYSLYIVFLGKSALKSLPSLTLAFWLSLFAWIEIGLIALPMGLLKFDMKAIGWLAEILLALVATVLALVLFQKGVFLCGEVKASLLSTFEPLTGIVIGMIIFHEQLSGKEVVGIAFVLLSSVLLVVNLKKNNRGHDKTDHNILPRPEPCGKTC